MEQDRVRKASDAMFHKLFRLFGRRARSTAEEIEAEAMRALEEAKRELDGSEERLDEPLVFGQGFDCSEDVELLA